MRTSILEVVGLCILCGLSVGCSGSTSASGPNGTPIAVAIHDSAPSGVSVLTYTMTISGMSMTNTNQHITNLITSPVTVQFHDLLTQSALLATNSAAPAATYSTMTITFSNVVMTILNASNSTITVGSTSCAPSQICTMKPALNQVTTTISSGAFPLTVTSAPLTLDVDVNISSSLQGNLSITPVVAVSAPPFVAGVLHSFNANGQITSVSGSSFTMTDAATGNSLNIDASNAAFVNFPASSDSCSTPDTVSCLATTQNLNVDYIVTSGTPPVLQANNIVLKNGITNGIEGVVIAAPVAKSSPDQFTMVVTGTSPTRTSMPIGTKLTVMTPTTPSSFAFLPVSMLTVPAPLAFTGASSVVAGQTIDVDSTDASASAGTGTATATAVLLVPSQFVGNLSAINSIGVSSLAVDGLNSVFTTGGVSSLNVLVQTGTSYLGVPFSGLVVGQPVTIGGEIFSGIMGPTVVGGQVGQSFTAIPAS
jgi:hypothetical protein